MAMICRIVPVRVPRFLLMGLAIVMAMAMFVRHRLAERGMTFHCCGKHGRIMCERPKRRRANDRDRQNKGGQQPNAG